MTEADKLALAKIAFDLTDAQRRVLRRIFLAHQDEAVDFFADLVCCTVVKLGEEWWLKDMQREIDAAISSRSQ